MKAIIVLITCIFAVSIPSLAQAQAGKWFGATDGGGSVALDLTMAGSAVTGRIIVSQGGQAVPMDIRKADVVGDGFTIRMARGNDMNWFSAQYAGDRITLRSMFVEPAAAPIVLSRVEAFPPMTLDPRASFAPETAPAGWRAFNRAATMVEEAGRQIVRVDQRTGDGVVWREGSSFTDGSIEVRMRVPGGRNFVGIAFRGANDETYDAIYFRPANFRAAEPARSRAVQYVSHPDQSWMKLRYEAPGRFESAISAPPDPAGWFNARIVVEGRTIRVFIDDAPTATLTVETLNPPRGRMIGLWVGNVSGGDFSDMKVTPKAP